MSEILNNLSNRYINKFILKDDYGYSGILYFNYDKEKVNKWIALYKFSKHCTIIHNPPIKKRGVLMSKERKFNLKKFVERLEENEHDIRFVTLEEYVKENPIKKPFMGIKRKRK